jgi:hypothetical protein
MPELTFAATVTCTVCGAVIHSSPHAVPDDFLEQMCVEVEVDGCERCAPDDGGANAVGATG